MDMNDNYSSLAYLLETSEHEQLGQLRTVQQHLLKTSAKYLNLESLAIHFSSDNDQLLSPE
jgi:hypothetical protein